MPPVVSRVQCSLVFAAAITISGRRKINRARSCGHDPDSEIRVRWAMCARQGRYGGVLISGRHEAHDRLQIGTEANTDETTCSNLDVCGSGLLGVSQ